MRYLKSMLKKKCGDIQLEIGVPTKKCGDYLETRCVVGNAVLSAKLGTSQK